MPRGGRTNSRRGQRLPDGETPVRTVAVWCADWSAVAAAAAAGVGAQQPVAVLHDNQVISCSQIARKHGVRLGQRRREAQRHCPQLAILGHDPARDAREFEAVAAAVEQVTPNVEIVRPGVCAFAATGAVRYNDGEAVLAERLIDAVGHHSGAEARVGIAEGVFAAVLAAQRDAMISAGATSAFLSDIDIGVLGDTALVDTLRQLGLTTLGAFAGLTRSAVATRFGTAVVDRHLLASGRALRPLLAREPTRQPQVGQEFDPPIERVDTAVFASHGLAAELTRLLDASGSGCTRLEIQARTATGEQLSRLWRHDTALVPAQIAQRVRWQLDGWLRHSSRPGGGVVSLSLIAAELVPHRSLQAGLWGELGEADERAHRAAVRVQALLGDDAVVTASRVGGRSSRQQIRYEPWTDARETPAHVMPDPAPWPGQIPAPHPAALFPLDQSSRQVTVTDAAGSPVGLTVEHALSAPPDRIALADGAWHAVRGFAGPWPCEQRWWDSRHESEFDGVPGTGYAQCQLLLAGPASRALLLGVCGQSWRLIGAYD